MRRYNRDVSKVHLLEGNPIDNVWQHVPLTAGHGDASSSLWAIIGKLLKFQNMAWRSPLVSTLISSLLPMRAFLLQLMHTNSSNYSAKPKNTSPCCFWVQSSIQEERRSTQCLSFSDYHWTAMMVCFRLLHRPMVWSSRKSSAVSKLIGYRRWQLDQKQFLDPGRPQT